MHTTLALVFRNLVKISRRSRSLPAAPRQRLAADLSHLFSQPRTWRFQVARGTGLDSALVYYFQLYAAIHYFYTGKTTRLQLPSPLPPNNVDWLDVRALNDTEDAININPDGTIAGLLPELPAGRCSNYSQHSYHTTLELLTWLAKRLWNFGRLRPGQYEIMARLARGENTLGILPTGAGKSLCFQALALLLPGTTLVVSPLKSLMRDQFTNLARAGVDGVDFIDSSRSAAEKRDILTKLRHGKLKMLYLAPERLQIENFQQQLAETLQNFPVSLFAIDEAHCISEWGHDFRPAYLRLRQFVAKLHQPPICALTATASRYVRQDILNLLGLNNQDIITPQSLDRQELSLQVKTLGPEDDYHRQLVNIVKTDIASVLGADLDLIHRHSAGVVFTPYAAPQGRHTRPLGTEVVSLTLQNQGLDNQIYHGQLADARRIAIQDKFKKNAFPLLVATKGYGMGIDKENIDYIIHLSAPSSLEAYYQEAGRAGRDGEHAHSVIIARPRHPKCESSAQLPLCHQGWVCPYTGSEKCDYGIQVGLLVQEYPSEQQSIQRFNRFLTQIEKEAQGNVAFRYVCKAQQAARHQKYLYYLQQLEAVQEYKVLEYLPVTGHQFDMLLYVELTAPNSLENKYWLSNKVVERIERYKQQRLNMLDTMQLYIKTQQCRRKFLLQYFGQQVPFDRCNFCDVEGISAQAAPASKQSTLQRDLHTQLDATLLSGNLATTLPVVELAQKVNGEQQVTVRAMRELEDRPDNAAALYLGGIFSCRHPETAAYGHRNLQGALAIAVDKHSDLAPALFSNLATMAPPVAYSLAVGMLEQLQPQTLKELASYLAPPDQYPDVHLALLLPQLRQINKALHREVL